jgi:hypothetical protein
MIRTVTLSDGKPCDVTVLPLFALIGIGPKDPGDFKLTIHTKLEETYTVLYNMPDEAPVVSDPNDTWQVIERTRYEAAIAHNVQRIALAEERDVNIALHVLDTCITQEDRKRIITDDDYTLVYEACLTREVTREDIARQSREFFPLGL